MIKNKSVEVITKEMITEDVVLVNDNYRKEKKDNTAIMTRAIYRKNGKYKYSIIEKEFGSFKDCIEACIGENKVYTREYFDIKRNSCEIGKRYFVSAIIAGMHVNEKFMDSILNYCKVNDTELILLVMRGVRKEDEFDSSVVEKYGEYFATSFDFNSNLKAEDYLLAPQQIISLTGLSRLTKKGASLIVAHSKLQMEAVASRVGAFHHLMYSTGCVSLPEYSANRAGRIARQDHKNSGIIVEVVDDKIFHVRDVSADSKYGFADLGKYYLKDKVSSIASEIVLGDSHIGIEDSVAHEVTRDMIKTLGCKKVYFQDMLDCRSVNHHEENDLFSQYDRASHQETLDKELTYLGKFLEEFTKDLGNVEYIVVPSNHNEFLSRYLTSGRFVFDVAVNAKLACELFSKHLEGNDIIEYFLTSRKFNIPKFKFPKREDIINSNGFDVIHGDVGHNGSRGSIKSLDICYADNISGHTHSGGIFRTSRKVGTLSKLIQRYNKAGGSSWTMTNVVTYANKTAQNINIVNDSWKM